MNDQKNMSCSSRRRSFGYAFNGLLLLLRQEPNFKLQVIAAIVAVIAGFIRHFGHVQWLSLIFAIALVLITEALNTCIEKLCDFACDSKIHPAIKVIKDISAAAVLLAACGSAIIGFIIFFL